MSHTNNNNHRNNRHTGGAGCIQAKNPGRDANQCLAEAHAKRVRELSERGVRIGDIIQTRTTGSNNHVGSLWGTLYVTKRPNKGALSYFFVAQVDTGHFQGNPPSVVLVHDRFRPQFSGGSEVPRGLKVFLKDRELDRLFLAFPNMRSPGRYEVMATVKVVCMTENAAQCVIEHMTATDTENVVRSDHVVVDGKVVMPDQRHRVVGGVAGGGKTERTHALVSGH